LAYACNGWLDIACNLGNTLEKATQDTGRTIEKMFEEVTAYKLLYDLLIAAVTGIITGIFVDYLFRSREKKKIAPAISLINAEILDMVTNFIVRILPPDYTEKIDGVCNFSKIASSFRLVKAKDEFWEKGSYINREVKA
jgi:hypothetical protein